MNVVARGREDRCAVPKPFCPVFILVETKCARVKAVIVVGVFDMEFVAIYAHDRPWTSKVNNDVLNSIGGCWQIITAFLVQFLNVEAELTLQGYPVVELMSKRETSRFGARKCGDWAEIKAVKAEFNQIAEPHSGDSDRQGDG
jgi:hypothetical protein